jgi:membrane protein DedA with SNARE-associated domain
MFAEIIDLVSQFVINLISSLGYSGVVIAMTIESACIPLPSEIILPFSGFLVYEGKFNLWLAGSAGTLGCLIGSLIAYFVGMKGGRPLVEKYGKYILISHHDLDLADRWFKKYGEATIFFSRLLPIVRTFISFPAGVAKMNLWRFSLYTVIGSFPWCVGLVYVGQRLGAHWEKIRGYFHRFDLVIGIILIAGIVWYVWRHLRNLKKEKSE